MVLLQPHPFRDPVESLPTAVIRLSPDFLAQLRKVAKRKKRSNAKLWAFAVLLVAIDIAFVAIPSTRAAIVAWAHHVTSAHPAAASPAAPLVAATPATFPNMLPSSSLVSMRTTILSLSSSLEVAKTVKHR